MDNIRLFKKSDILILAICILTAILLLLFGTETDNALTAVITVNREEYTQIDLSSISQEQEFYVNGVTIVAGNNYIYIKDSECPNKICIKTGKLTKSGQAAACVPQGVAIYIQNDDNSNIDAMVY